MDFVVGVSIKKARNKRNLHLENKLKVSFYLIFK